MRGKIKAPFFELGPKAYWYGKDIVDLAVEADRISETYGVDIIFTAAYTDIRPVAEAVKHVHVFAQHMDGLYPGRGIGAVLPEAIKDAGAEGVLLNHAERPLTLSELNTCIRRAREIGLKTLVCAGTAEEAAAVACLKPDIVLAESPRLIGGGKRGPEDAKEIERINRMVHDVAPEIKILHGAGISDEKDIFEIILAGADAAGSSSAVMKAEKPAEMLENMVAAAAEAWKIRKEKEKENGSLS